MLVQTPVARVATRFSPFLAAFPTPERAARASLGELLSAWDGLGYPRRARNLRESAAVISDRHAGAVPDTLSDLLALPGVGAYTARAVLAFAFDHAVVPLDTNVSRVVVRALGGGSIGRPEAQRTADRLLAGFSGGRASARALMDLGAAFCRPNPRCAHCPLGRGPKKTSPCHWRRGGGEDPVRLSFAAPRPKARYEGSDRQARGRLLRALREGRPLVSSEVAAAAGLGEDPARAMRVADSLVGDGLVARAREGYRLAE